MENQILSSQLHATANDGNSRAVAAGAAYNNAARRSSGSRSGYACTISFPLMRSATMPTTVVTGIRNARIQSTPPLGLGLTEMRVNFQTRPSAILKRKIFRFKI